MHNHRVELTRRSFVNYTSMRDRQDTQNVKPGNKNIMKNILLYSFFIFIATGCATTSTGPKFSSVCQVSDSKAHLYIYRIDDTGRVRTPDLIINEKKVAELPNNSYFYAELDPGEYRIQTKWVWDVKIPPVNRKISFA